MFKRKPEDNILNQIKPNEKIFRVVSVERFFELITGQTLTLVKLYKWDDPFENFLSKTIFLFKGQKIIITYQKKIKPQFVLE